MKRSVWHTHMYVKQNHTNSPLEWFLTKFKINNKKIQVPELHFGTLKKVLKWSITGSNRRSRTSESLMHFGKIPSWAFLIIFAQHLISHKMWTSVAQHIRFCSCRAEIPWIQRSSHREENLTLLTELKISFIPNILILWDCITNF